MARTDEDQPAPRDRTRKLEGREKSRRHRQSGRGFLHAMTNRRVKRQQEILDRDGPDGSPESPPEDN